VSLAHHTRPMKTVTPSSDLPITSRSPDTNREAPPANHEAAPAAPSRLQSLDVYRGLIMGADYRDAA
jgi:hypothetical protein